MDGVRNTHGGAREGSGRKKLSESGRKQIQFSLQQEEIDLIKQLSKENNMPASRFVM
ncbi:MAG: hypothetical protein MJ196_04345 [Treponemataceae bacterium]|nr:hypothetical protein [Treponemataceae bacterium]